MLSPWCLGLNEIVPTPVRLTSASVRPRESGDPAHSASLRAFTPVFDGLWTRVNALMAPGFPLEFTLANAGAGMSGVWAALERRRLRSVLISRFASPSAFVIAERSREWSPVAQR